MQLYRRVGYGTGSSTTATSPALLIHELRFDQSVQVNSTHSVTCSQPQASFSSPISEAGAASSTAGFRLSLIPGLGVSEPALHAHHKNGLMPCFKHRSMQFHEMLASDVPGTSTTRLCHCMSLQIAFAVQLSRTLQSSQAHERAAAHTGTSSGLTVVPYPNMTWRPQGLSAS
jgi:hypothetical protein